MGREAAVKGFASSELAEVAVSERGDASRNELGTRRWERIWHKESNISTFTAGGQLGGNPLSSGVDGKVMS